MRCPSDEAKVLQHHADTPLGGLLFFAAHDGDIIFEQVDETT